MQIARGKKNHQQVFTIQERRHSPNIMHNREMTQFMTGLQRQQMQECTIYKRLAFFQFNSKFAIYNKISLIFLVFGPQLKSIFSPN